MPSSPPHPESPLHGAASTLFLPMVVRAQAAMLCPWLDPHDRHAQRVLQQTGDSLFDHPADAGTVLNILWRTQKIREPGQDSFERFSHEQGITSSGWTTVRTAGWMWTCPRWWRCGTGSCPKPSLDTKSGRPT